MLQGRWNFMEFDGGLESGDCYVKIWRTTVMKSELDRERTAEVASAGIKKRACQFEMATLLLTGSLSTMKNISRILAWTTEYRTESRGWSCIPLGIITISEKVARLCSSNSDGKWRTWATLCNGVVISEDVGAPAFQLESKSFFHHCVFFLIHIC